MIKHIDLFSGIGGFALALDRVFENVEHTFCEIDPFCQEVLKKHWPNSKIHNDIKNLSRSSTEQPFILTGGFPCQPFSAAGLKRGTEDDRYLWPEMFRVIRECQPTWVIAENVRGLVNWNNGLVLETVRSDLESIGYEVQPIIIPACAVGAPHRRYRIWFVAHSNGDGPRRYSRSGGKRSPKDKNKTEVGKQNWKRLWSDTSGVHPEIATAANSGRPRRKGKKNDGTRQRNSPWHDTGSWFEVASKLCRVDDGIPRRLDRNPRLKALGNAIVPQIAEEIIKAIKLTTL